MKQTHIYLTEEQHGRLKRIADREHRSISAQVQLYVDRALDAEEAAERATAQALKEVHRG